MIVTMQEVIPGWNEKGSLQGRLLEQGLWKGRKGVKSPPMGEVWVDGAGRSEAVHFSLTCWPLFCSVQPASRFAVGWL